MNTSASLFSGGGLAEAGMIAAGLTPIWGVELDPQIAEVYRTNIGAHVIVGDVAEVDFGRLERPNLLWASPPCVNFSQAKSNREETGREETQAEAVCRALQILTPDTFILENVIGYRKSRSFAQIKAALDALGYFWSVAHVNSANMGVPQTRRRLILRASRLGLLSPLPAPVPWVGWYAAIEDLIPTLPESQFAPWQLARLSSERLGTFLHMTSNTNIGHPTGSGILPEPCPANTVHPGSGNARAFLVGSMTNDHGTRVTVPDGDAPSMTVRASCSANRSQKAWLEQGRTVSMTPRALARFQSLPDSYELPESRALASRIIGNGVPCLMAQVIAASMQRGEA